MTVVPIHTAEARLDAACRWVLRLDEGLSDDEVIALERWIAEHPANRQALLEAATIWDKLDSLTRLATLFPEEEDRALRPRTRSIALPTALVASCAAVALIAGGLFFSQRAIEQRGRNVAQHDQPATTTLSTAVGEQTRTPLADGSTLTLNTQSRATIRLAAQSREIVLHQGELHVDVAKDPERPLTVLAADHRVEAIGTAFSVQLHPDRTVDLTVSEGVVSVTQIPKAQSSPDLLAQTAAPRRQLKSGQTTLLGVEKAPVERLSPEQIDARLSWRNGRLVFRDDTLERALLEVERYTPVRFVFLDESLKLRTVSGRFRAGDVEALLLSLNANFNIAHRYDGEHRVLLGSP